MVLLLKTKQIILSMVFEAVGQFKLVEWLRKVNATPCRVSGVRKEDSRGVSRHFSVKSFRGKSEEIMRYFKTFRGYYGFSQFTRKVSVNNCESLGTSPLS